MEKKTQQAIRASTTSRCEHARIAGEAQGHVFKAVCVMENQLRSPSDRANIVLVCLPFSVHCHDIQHVPPSVPVFFATEYRPQNGQST